MKRTLLFMGPVTPPYTGQAIAFTTIIRSMPDDTHFIVLDIEKKKKNIILHNIALYFKIAYTLLFKHISLIYFTCSRSVFGSVRDLVLLFWARILKIKVINHLHGSDFMQFYNKLPRWYQHIVYYYYSKVDVSIILTEGMRSEFSIFKSMKVYVVPNAYSSDLDTCPEKKNNQNTDRFKILYLSNIVKSKGIIHLLKACEDLFEKHNNIELNIAGTFIGDHLASPKEVKAEFESCLNQLSGRYPGQINYLGVATGDKKKQLLMDSDVFILPSYHPTEAFPISILEAMRAGNYIISTRHNHIPEILSDKNGCLITPDSKDAIKDAIESVITQREMMTEAQNFNIGHAIQNYSEDNYLKNVFHIIDSLS